MCTSLCLHVRVCMCDKNGEDRNKTVERPGGNPGSCSYESERRRRHTCLFIQCLCVCVFGKQRPLSFRQTQPRDHAISACCTAMAQTANQHHSDKPAQNTPRHTTHASTLMIPTFHAVHVVMIGHVESRGSEVTTEAERAVKRGGWRQAVGQVGTSPCSGREGREGGGGQVGGVEAGVTQPGDQDQPSHLRG